MGSRVILIGAGGHARVVLDALARAGGFQVIGLTDADPARAGGRVEGVEILGDDEAMSRLHAPDQVLLVNGLGSTRDVGARRRVFETLRGRGYAFATVIHPRAILARSASLGEGAQVMAGAVVQPGAHLGDNVLVNSGAVVDHDCRIGEHSHVAPGATLSGGVSVGPGSHIGTGACVIQGVRIGAGALVGAGAVVLRDVPDGATVMGVPARERGA